MVFIVLVEFDKAVTKMKMTIFLGESLSVSGAAVRGSKNVLENERGSVDKCWMTAL